MPYKDRQKRLEAQKENYQRNKLRYKENKSKREKSLKEWLWELKKELVCSKCGFDDHRCIDFHHLDKSQKSFGISQAVKYGYARETILREIEKCIPVCANCHIMEHEHVADCYSERIVLLNEMVQEMKSEMGCKVCKEKNPRKLAFHHIASKTRCVTKMVKSGYSKSKIMEEIAKCEVLCQNCHRIEHEGNVWLENSGV